MQPSGSVGARHNHRHHCQEVDTSGGAGMRPTSEAACSKLTTGEDSGLGEDQSAQQASVARGDVATPR